MPLTMYDAIRVGLVWSFMSRERDTKSAAPTATRALVRSPAGCCRHCRSMPISVPSTSASPTFPANSSSSIAPPGFTPGARQESAGLVAHIFATIASVNCVVLAVPPMSRVRIFPSVSTASTAF